MEREAAAREEFAVNSPEKGKEKAFGGLESWSILVDNLSKQVTRAVLKELFSHYGRVVRIFILMVNRKAKYRDTTFAFVSVSSRGELEVCISKSDNSLVDGKKIRVSAAKYPRRRVVSHDKDEKQQKAKGYMRKGFGPPIGSERRGANRVEGRSYKDALLGESRGGAGRVAVRDLPIVLMQDESDGSIGRAEISIKDTKWMESCLVGIIKRDFEVDLVQKGLISAGIEAKVVRWGSDPKSVIISFESSEILDNCWKSKKGEIRFWFEYIDSLLLNDIPHVFCMVNLVGVPLSCWFEEFFSWIGNRWGFLLGFLTALERRTAWTKRVLRVKVSIAIVVQVYTTQVVK
ncbi:hypothetical protein HRI_003319200 [Hibiscus trionum]|uniref:RRM domain-containing protein n=1 Tax=Hibiscus trionum TaxID=183268 RepID=A0A9W7MDR2_HIBTR|nr:hypothetical protein HRI_003319200 [Hibiscus trionum]